MDRRKFLKTSTGFGTTLLLPASVWAKTPAHATSPAIIGSDKVRPNLPSGVQIGDVVKDRAIFWARSDRPARMMIEWDTTDRFKNARRITGPWAQSDNDFVTQVDVSGLPAGQRIFGRIWYEDAGTGRTASPIVPLSFKTSTDNNEISQRPVRFVWSGDTAGQGFGINPEWGGMRIYETMRLQQPDFFIHSGDTIYADGPIESSKQVEDGRVWTNIVTEEVSKVAESLNEYRGRYRYNLMDENVRRFAQEIPQIWQWDDHEVVNNWSSSKDLSGDNRYTVKDVNTLLARGKQAFLEYAPLRLNGHAKGKGVYRHIPYGSMLDIFMLDMRSYRGPNTNNLQTNDTDETAFLGNNQVTWLIDQLKKSKATWKVISADMPIGLHVADGKDAKGVARWEAIANGENDIAKGREREIARLLAAIKRHRIKNVVWLTADVHYTAAHYYHPSKAMFTDFEPFWEFVSGPLNAGSFGPNALDMTFGPELKFQAAPEAQNTSPFKELQFFGQVDIDPKTKEMVVSLKDLNNKTLYRQTLSPKVG